ncbi:MAG: transglutaminase domain-containing protein [Ruminococcaceae bacterium]|nr:transglutaminase domain-containing protein [Oscillospiraceae bacterium]
MNRSGRPLRFLAVLFKICCGWVYATALSQLILRLNRLPVLSFEQAMTILVALLVLALLTWSRYQLLALTVGLVTGGAALWLARDSRFVRIDLPIIIDDWQQRFSWAYDYMRESSPGSRSAMLCLASVICVLLALLAYITIVRFSRPFLAGGTLLATLLLAQNMDLIVLYGWTLPAGLVVLLTLARHQKKTWPRLRQQKQVLSARIMLQALPASLLVIIVALLFNYLVPTSLFHTRHLEGWFDDLTGRLQLPGQQLAIPEFSLSHAGYYPLTNRLGGPVSLSADPVLQVSGQTEAFLLKGSVSQIYDGQRWIQDLDRTYYRFDSPRWREEQDQAFTLDLPDFSRAPDLSGQFSSMSVIQWSPVGMPTQTLFSAGQPLAVTLVQDEPFLAYFRPSGQLFSKHWIRADQSVAMQVRLPRTGQAGFAETVTSLAGAHAAGENKIPTTVTLRYLQLPALAEYEEDGALRNLARHLISDQENPYTAVQAIRRYLMDHYRYRLDVTVPPDDVDFVSWFFATGEGYCVYFATAMTMLCRLVDIPARYVEGYYVPTAQEDKPDRLLTGRHAHAWTEVYLAGIGWIPVDATPGTFTRPAEPEAEASLTITPLPTMPLQAMPTPVVSVTPDTQDEDVIAPLTADQIARRTLPWLLPGLAILAAWIVWTVRQLRDPLFLSRQMPEARSRLLFYWEQIQGLLQDLGCRRTADQTPAQYLMMQCEQGRPLCDHADLASQAAGVLDDRLYGPFEPVEEDVDLLAAFTGLLVRTVRQQRGLSRGLLSTARLKIQLVRLTLPGRPSWFDRE